MDKTGFRAEAAKILDLIEGVDLADTSTLDEIDARVWCYITNRCFAKLFYIEQVPHWKCTNRTVRSINNNQKFTRSRDALKSIRPDGVVVQVTYYPQGFQGDAVGAKGQSPRLPTEELAELHAIIQAIEWERNNGK